MTTIGNYSFQICLVEIDSWEKDVNSTADDNGCNNIPGGLTNLGDNLHGESFM